MKHPILPIGLATSLLMVAGPVNASSKTEDLKRIMDGLENGQVDDRLIEAYVDNHLKDQVGEVQVWTGYQKTSLDDDRQYVGKSSDSYTRTLGIDYQLTPRAVLGMVLLDQSTDTTSDPSDDSARGYSEVDDDTRGLALRGQYLLNSGLMVDGAVTYLNTDTDITDLSNWAAPSTKSTESQSFILNLGSSLVYPLNPDLLARGRIGLAYQRGSQDAYADEYDRYHEDQEYESGTLSLDTGLHYNLTPAVTPYAEIRLAYDLVSDAASPALVSNPGGTTATSVPYQEERDRFSYGVQLGVNWTIIDDVTVDASYRHQQWGSDIQTGTLGANLRYVF